MKESKTKYSGLTSEEVQERIEKKQVNYDTSVPTKTIKRILFDNIFTLFNLINVILGLAIFAVGSYKNATFLLIAIINTAISSIQEIHSKKVVDKLSLMSTSKTKVFRNGKKIEIPIHELVLDDIVELNTGNQIATDNIILEGTIQVDESFITGEPDSITKKAGDELLSGSIIVSGKCICKVQHVGEDNYVAKISKDAKYVKKVNSEIMTSLQRIIRILTVVIIPIGIALFVTQLQTTTIQNAVVKSVAGIIGLIPEGLVLLTSTVLAVSVLKLSKSNVLVQELYCIETLARVDTLCLDKTGTLTEGIMEVKDFIPLTTSAENMENILSNITKFSEDENSTMLALRNRFKKPNQLFVPNQVIHFSSKDKWSGINFENEGSYIIGAPEFVLKDNLNNYTNIIDKYLLDYRVLVLAHSSENFNDNKLPKNVELVGLILILDKIRPEAKNTIKYFYKQKVDIKIISGDNPVTVSKIAKQVNIKKYDKYIDMSQVEIDEKKLKKLVSKYTIFGRVSPMQKKALVKALQSNGKTVAMTGDGVNDVLALKEADCSIAMANGSDATKSISHLVLLDSNFASMPKIVAEGRQTINNIQRSASLFLVKTIYSFILALMFLFMGSAYPFDPVHITLISVVTIGIPSFLLALEPNYEKIKGHFLRNVIVKAIPAGLTVALNIFLISMYYKQGFISMKQYSSLCVISTGVCGLILLFTMSRTRKNEETELPFSIFRLGLAIVLTGLFIFGLTSLNWWFNIVDLAPLTLQIALIVIASLLNFIILSILFSKIFKIEKRVGIDEE